MAATCSGFLYGLQIADSLMATVGYRKALVLWFSAYLKMAVACWVPA
ncbi:MAG: hypothetical protein IH612_03705 [Desulfofustis sp.]|nr:hypothetical protein [Desulfofustis sp.]